MKKLFFIMAFLAGLTHAQTIEFVVSASAGGPNDTVTRKIADAIEQNSNLKIVVTNKPGGAHTVAYNYVVTSNKPTLIMETPQIENHEVFSQMDEMFNAGYFTNILFVSEKSGMKSLKDLKNKKEVLFGHGGVGSFSHMAMQAVCEKELKCLDVPYKSAAEGMMGLLSGTIDAYAIVSYGSKQFIENDRYAAIYKIRTEKSKSWYKLFGKNLSDKEKQTIILVLKSLDGKFYSDMGLEK
jgi:tripartite-type tricarboxylate transporter receptor subunit TctC